MRFIILYRECVNEYGWIKRHECRMKAGIDQADDEILSKLKQQEQQQEQEERVAEEMSEKGEEDEEGKREEEIYIPQVEYTAVCNCDYMPMVCNDFVTEFLDKEHGACQLDRAEAIDLTRNFNYWVASNDLTCCRISLYF